jgi:pimeloyl-ACP methyl ester carboxylesterase
MYAVDLNNPVSPRERYKIKGTQGVTLSIQEWGNPNGKAILFAHAYGMSHLAWLAQVNSELVSEFRLISFDYRGHGESDKPTTEDGYNSSKVSAHKLLTNWFLMSYIDSCRAKH